MSGELEQANGPERARRAPEVAAPSPERGGSAGPVVRRTPDRRQTPPIAIGALARAAGNRAVISRITDEALEARAAAPAAAPPAISSSDDRALFDSGTTGAGDPGPLKDIGSWGGFTEAERMRALSVLTNQGWAGPRDEACMERIWSSFSDIPAVAARNIAMWEACIDRGGELADLPAIAALRTTFETDVKSMATGYMNRNLQSVVGEIENLGAESTGATAEEQHARDGRLDFMQILLREIDNIQEASRALQRIPVGYRMQTRHHADGNDTEMVTATFNPTARPQIRADGETGFGDWDLLKSKWDILQAFMARYTAMSPMAYIALREGSASRIANASPTEARSIVSEQLRSTEGRIRETLPKIGDGDLAWQDLQPIHQQLYAGARSASGTNWGQRFFRSIGEDVIGDHEGMQTLLAVGMGTLAGAAFVIAELGTLGAATPFLVAGGVGLGLTQAGMSWERWDDLNTAARSSASAETELITSGQADEALLTAALDTVFAVIDLFPIAKSGHALWQTRRAARALEEARGITGLSRLARGAEGMAPEAIRTTVSKGVRELGVAEVLARTGKSPEELIALVGERSDIGEQIAQYRRLLESAGEGGATALRETVGERLALIGAGRLAGEEAERAAREALTALGPVETIKRAGGWTRLSSTLGNDSASGKALVAWREGLFQDLQRWADAGGLDRIGVEAGSPVLEATGSRGAFKNDLDISTHGTNAAANRDVARRYLADRAGCGVGELNNVLKNDFFTSASRMHAYDAVPEELRNSIRIRQAALQQQLIMNSQLHHAVEAGDEALAAQLRAQMAAAGVPERHVTILTRTEAETLAHEVDDLQARLVAASSDAERQRIADQIVERQAQVNAAEEGGYFSSGGTRRFVTERKAREAVGSTMPAMPAAERMSAMIDQIPKIEHAAQDLRTAIAAGDVPGIADALRNIGKYGKRMSEVGFEGAAEGPLKTLADDFERLYKRFNPVGEGENAVAAALPDANEVQTLVSNANRHINDVGSASQAMLEQLRAGSGIDHDLVSITHVSQMMAAHARYLAAANAAQRAMEAEVARLLRIAGRSAETGARAGNGDRTSTHTASPEIESRP